ncbi:MAG: 5'-nucleotidase [Burkholderiaceae bacterium]|jgi:5'-nucleotidase
MPLDLNEKLVIAISSRALFDFEEENRIFETHDDRAYMALQMARMHDPAPIGVAFPLVKKLLGFNNEQQHRVEVVILSRNDPVSGLRAFKTAQSFGLKIERGVFTRGRPPFSYLKPLGAHLFLSANEDDVRGALDAGFPAARVFSDSLIDATRHPDELRIAFDGDAVLFSDEAEMVFQQGGLPAFEAHELQKMHLPLPAGPLKPLLEALHKLQQSQDPAVRIRTALVTARSAPAHERAIRTLMDWNIEIDEAMFLGGLSKGAFLKEFEPDFFFDDQFKHCESSVIAGPTAQVLA